MTTLDWIVELHTTSTIAMFGLIWFVQLVHYPLYTQIGHDSFIAYESSHMRRTTCVVAPLMLCEIATAMALLFLVHDGPARIWVVTGFATSFTLWLMTLFIQSPMHARLENGYDEHMVRRLIGSNWLRTMLWSGRVVMALVIAHLLST